MSIVLISQSTSCLINQRKGYIAMSLNHWDDSLEPNITEGSIVEIGGSLYQFSSDTSIDSTTAWAGFGNSTLVYCYVNPATLVCVLTSTAPTWDDEKQGWYDATNTYRYILTIFKDASGNYTQKTILLDRERGITDGGVSFLNSANEDKIIRFASDAYVMWDESAGYFLNSPGVFRRIYQVEDQKASNTNGGSSVTGSWLTRTLGTEVTTGITGASLASNQFTLPAGTYWIEAWASFYKTDGTGIKIYNITDTSDEIYSENICAGSNADVGVTASLKGRITIASAKTFELQYKCSTATANTGLGKPLNFGNVETYARVIILQEIIG